jgi:hypothetical protein
MAGRHGQYPPELREWAVRLVAECRPDHASEWEAMQGDCKVSSGRLTCEFRADTGRVVI